MSSVTFDFDYWSPIHVTDEQIRIIADTADLRIRASFTDPDLVQALLLNIEDIRKTLQIDDDYRDGTQWILCDHCESEYEIIENQNPAVVDQFVSREDADNDPEALMEYPFWHAAHQASLMWGFPLSWHLKQPSEVEATPSSSFGMMKSFQKSDIPANQLDSSIPEVTPVKKPCASMPSQRAGPVSKAKNGLKHAPSPNVPFPKVPANMTVVEILVFLPQWITSKDIVSRILANGGAQRVAALIMLAHRSGMADEINTTNMILKKIYRAMRLNKGEKWVTADFLAPEDHDENNIDVSGLRTQFQFEGKIVPSKPNRAINFKDLANGVANMPAGADALDLTHFVQYALSNPSEDFMFPDDWDKLTKLLGSHTNTQAHTDRAVFHRYIGAPTLRRRKNSDERNTDISEDNEEIAAPSKKPHRPVVKKTAAPSKKSTRPAVKKTAFVRSIVPKKRAAKQEDSDTDSDVSEFQGSRRAITMGKKMARKGVSRQSGRKRSAVFQNLDDETLFGEESENDR